MAWRDKPKVHIKPVRTLSTQHTYVAGGVGGIVILGDP